jgi:hypothetical protein
MRPHRRRRGDLGICAPQVQLIDGSPTTEGKAEPHKLADATARTGDTIRIFCLSRNCPGYRVWATVMGPSVL